MNNAGDKASAGIPSRTAGGPADGISAGARGLNPGILGSDGMPKGNSPGPGLKDSMRHPH